MLEKADQILKTACGNIDKMLEAMTYNKDDAAIFLDKPFTKTNWMVNVLEENLSLRQSDLNGPLIEIIERILANNEGFFVAYFTAECRRLQ